MYASIYVYIIEFALSFHIQNNPWAPANRCLRNHKNHHLSVLYMLSSPASSTVVTCCSPSGSSPR